MGQYVDKVPSFNVHIGSPWRQINDTVDYTRSYANEMRKTLSKQLDVLASVIGQYVPDFGDIKEDIPTIYHPARPVKPDTNVDLNNNWPSINVPEPPVKEATADFSYTDPEGPGDIDLSFDHTPGVYASCMWDAFCEKIKTSLLNGGTGLNDAVYAAIIDRNREARRSAEDRGRRRMLDAVGARGLDLPGGMATAAILEFEREVLAKDVDAINSTTIKEFELADSNERFVKEMALKVEEMQRGDFNKKEDRLLDIAKTAKGFVVSAFEQKVKKYIAEWGGVEAKLRAAKSQIDAIISENDANIKIFLGRTEALKTKVLAISAENDSKTKLAQSRASIYESEVRAVATEFNVLLEEVKVAMEKYKTDVTLAVQKEGVNLQAFTSASSLAERVSESIAKIASQAVASALGAINTSMSYGYSGSTSARASKTLSNSLTESHPYKES